ncbi:MAG: hypothetical protein G01um1014107_56 [Parcubacteria group bacterium Gr01-1014_107]|nr:MAG: hypothetical protein G01um1014107_56 [Parcubacteria group bacterium Gr01-1014_107]
MNSTAGFLRVHLPNVFLATACLILQTQRSVQTQLLPSLDGQLYQLAATRPGLIPTPLVHLLIVPIFSSARQVTASPFPAINLDAATQPPVRVYGVSIILSILTRQFCFLLLLSPV